MLGVFLKRDIRLLVVRGSLFMHLFLLFFMALFFLGLYVKDLPLLMPQVVFLSFFILSQGLVGVFFEDRRYGFLDMVALIQGGLFQFLLSKVLVIAILVGGILTLLCTLFFMMQGMVALLVMPLFFSFFLAATLISLMLSSFVEGSRAFKGGLFILAMPFYVPLFLIGSWMMEQGLTISFQQTMTLTIGILLFYGPLCFGGAIVALRGAVQGR